MVGLYEFSRIASVADAQRREQAEQLGLRFGDKGAHTSRTIMLADLTAILAAVPDVAARDEYDRAIVEENVLGKPTSATRRLSRQRLAELYVLDPRVPIFRILRRLWGMDELARPLLALLCSLARDPLLRATAPAVLSLSEGEEFPRLGVRDAVREAVGERLNDNILDKVVRNAASSWSQAGHLRGRTFKVRRHVMATPASVAYALYFGDATGFQGLDLFGTAWVAALDADPSKGRDLAFEAKRLGLIDLRMSDDIFQMNVRRLDPLAGKV